MIIDRPLSEIAEINRGASIFPHVLKERIVNEDTGIQYLAVSHIQENYIIDDLPFLKNIEDREIKYLLKENDIVLTKMGQSKFALVKNIGERKIISTQNFYILRFNESVNPLYIKAFFESDLGFQRLEAAYIKKTIPILPVKNLTQIQVPLFADPQKGLEIQKELIQRYEATEKKEFELFREYQQQRKKRISLFSEVIGECYNVR